MLSNGLHHVALIASNVARSVEFYNNVIGLRLVKQTVNAEDPTVLRCLLGDHRGRPGTLISVWQWSDILPGELGFGGISAVWFAIPLGSAPVWHSKLQREGQPATLFLEGPDHFVQTVDPDGLTVCLAECPYASPRPDSVSSRLADEHAVRSLYGATWIVGNTNEAADFFSQILGLKVIERSDSRTALAGSAGIPGRYIFLQHSSFPCRAGPGIGNHLAFRVATADEFDSCKEALDRRGISTSPVMDWHYAKSFFFRDPSGGLIEVATDYPGVLFDESLELLGTELKIPPPLEFKRAAIERLFREANAAKRTL